MSDVYIQPLPRQPWRKCPSCGELHDALTGVSNKPVREARDGDPMICTSCGEWGILDSTVEGDWRIPVSAEIDEALSHPEFMMAVFLTKRQIRQNKERDE